MLLLGESALLVLFSPPALPPTMPTHRQLSTWGIVTMYVVDSCWRELGEGLVVMCVT